jgi:hypothetical protein
MSIAINNNYGNYNFAVNNNTYLKTSKDDEKDTGKEAGVVQSGVTYEKTAKDENSKEEETPIYKKSSTDRAAIVEQLKAAEEQRRNQLMSIVQKTLQGQAGAYGKATGDNIWQQLSSGNVKVDAATRAQAQKDISEDGYYGVKQTSQRLFDFASALAGDNVDKMKEMQKAMEKGFKQATKTWGKELPSICKETINAANKLFEDYYKSKE